MASVYILYCPQADKFYIGCSKDLSKRIEFHTKKEFQGSYTAKYFSWELFYSIDDLTISTARKIESHIKKMKSKQYIKNLKHHASISEGLIAKYS